MTGLDSGPRFKVASYAYEFLLSLDVAFAIVTVVELENHRALAPFFQLEFFIHSLLHVRETDLIRGYIAFGVSSIVLALCIWPVMRLFARAGTMRFVAGAAVLAAPLAFWVFMYQKYGWPLGWPYRGTPFEMILALASAQLYLKGNWRFPAWFSVLLLAAHFTYWFWIPGGNYSAANYSGPIAPVLGFASALAWALYVKSVRAT